MGFVYNSRMREVEVQGMGGGRVKEQRYLDFEGGGGFGKMKSVCVLYLSGGGFLR